MKRLLILIFLLAIGVRFIYFPDNIYFGFDQARDAFAALNIYKNFDFKIIGPSTAMENLFHGPLYWYLIGPFYLLGGGNPEVAAAFLLILNAIGIFVIFWIGKMLFNQIVGYFAAFLYAVSFEQSQYALYFGNPAPAVLTAMLFYAGLGLFLFKKKWLGLPLSLFALGLSVQFEFFLIYLICVFVVFTIFFRRNITARITTKRILFSLVSLLAPISTFIVAELKFGFRTITALSSVIRSTGSTQTDVFPLFFFWEKLILHVNDNLLMIGKPAQTVVLGLIFIFSAYLIVKKKKESDKVLFLMIWFFSSIFLYLFGIPKLYYSNIGIAPSLILLTSFLIYKIYSKGKILAIAILVIILVSNVVLILERNSKGIINDIYVQEGMLLSKEKKAIDFIYQRTRSNPAVVSALTMPLKINTTWAYLFNWYGGGKYGYVPYWAGETATGYPGSLPSWKSQEENYIMFSIIEPTRGVRSAFVEQFLAHQEQYGTVVEEVIFGDGVYSRLVVQVRMR